MWLQGFCDDVETTRSSGGTENSNVQESCDLDGNMLVDDNIYSNYNYSVENYDDTRDYSCAFERSRISDSIFGGDTNSNIFGGNNVGNRTIHTNGVSSPGNFSPVLNPNGSGQQTVDFEELNHTICNMRSGLADICDGFHEFPEFDKCHSFARYSELELNLYGEEDNFEVLHRFAERPTEQHPSQSHCDIQRNNLAGFKDVHTNNYSHWHYTSHTRNDDGTFFNPKCRFPQNSVSCGREYSSRMDCGHYSPTPTSLQIESMPQVSNTFPGSFAFYLPENKREEGVCSDNQLNFMATNVRKERIGQRLLTHLQAWKEIKCERLIKNGVMPQWKEKGKNTQRLERERRPFPFTGSQLLTIEYQHLLTEELREGVVVPVPHHYVKWYNSTFLVPKKSGGYRKVLNCRRLNDEMRDIHFKMEDLKTVKDIILLGDYVVSLDITSAYNHVSVHPSLRPYLGFMFAGQSYVYVGMPFGNKDAP
jgi:hypothetical protein